MALWTEDYESMPPEWTEFLLMKDVFHCTPSQLAEEDYDRVATFAAIYSAYAKHLADKQRERAGK